MKVWLLSVSSVGDNMGLPVKIWARPQRVFRIHPGEENSDFSGSLWRRKSQFFWPASRQGNFISIACPGEGVMNQEPRRISSCHSRLASRHPAPFPSGARGRTIGSNPDRITPAPLLVAFYWAQSKTHVLPCILECICHLWPPWPHFPMLCSGTTLRAHQPHSSRLMWDYRICRVVWSVWSSALSFDLCILNHDFAVLSLPSSRVHLSHIPSLLLCGENLLRLESRDYLPVSGWLPFFL